MIANDSLEVIKLYIACVQDTVKNILLVKKQLQNNSLEAKGEVHSSISRQLEALRSREVWLLDQVDTIQHVKEDILDEQLIDMQHELGAARALLATAENPFQNMELTNQLQATIANLEQLSFDAKEDGSVHFSADQKHLRDTIYGFGHIQASKRHIVDAEGSNKKVCFSDVREVDHGELYRSLTELKEKKDKCMDAIPAWALQNKEWLIKTPTNTPAEPYSDLLFPPFRRNESFSEWLQKVQEVTEISSLRNADDEEEEEQDDFDMAESDVLSFEMISSVHQETEVPVVGHSYFDEILTSPTKEWLQNPERIRLEYEMGVSYPYSVMRYFRDISKDTRVWLADYEERKKLEEVEEKNKELMVMSCVGQCACTASSLVVQNIEIENLDHLICVREPISNSTTLQKRLIDDEDEVMVPSIEKVCRANEICESYSECVCDTKCCQVYSQSESVDSSEWSIPELKNQSHWSSSSTSHWLSSSGSRCLSSSTDKNTSQPSNFPYFQRVRSEKNGDWLRSEKDGDWLLSTESHKVHSGRVNPLKVYLATRPDKNSDWLASNEKCEKLEFNCDDTWLAKKVTEGITQQSDVWQTIQKHHSCYNSTDWLNTDQRSTSSPMNLQQFDTWKTIIDHHSKYKEADWRISSPNPHNEETNETPASKISHVENKECQNWLMSIAKADIDGEEKWMGLRKNTQTKVSDWLLGTIPDDIRGIVYKMDDIHLTTPPSKWLQPGQPKNTKKKKVPTATLR